MSQQQKRNHKKGKKSETEGNILIFYALQYAASSVLTSKVSATKISFKSATKAQVQYSYVCDDPVSKDQQMQIEAAVNKMLSSNTRVTCSKREGNNDCKLPSGIDGESQLYDVAINDDHLCTSHIPILMDNLGILCD